MSQYGRLRSALAVAVIASAGVVGVVLASTQTSIAAGAPIDEAGISAHASGELAIGGGVTNTSSPPAPAVPALLAPDPAWVANVAIATGIPDRAIQAYAAAELTISAEDPACGLGWNTLAAIGSIESDHGRHGGAVLGGDGVSVPAIRGPALDGHGVAAITDTDGGAWDGDAVWDRAVGPLQFIPDTWQRWGADGNGDGIADPNQIDDAALAAARYLCASGAMVSPERWRAAVFSYNHLDAYVDDVAHVANRYAGASAQ